MEFWIIPILFGLSVLAALGAGVWLLLHLQALATIFRGSADIVPSPKQPRVSRRAVWLAIATFSAGLIACLAIFVFSSLGGANEILVQ